MRWFVRRLAVIVAVVSTSMAAPIATAGVSSAQCDRNMSWNPVTNACKPPPAPPDWYVARPAYAPPYASLDVPPPPPWPSWSPQAPTWNTGFQHWGVWIGGVWVPI